MTARSLEASATIFPVVYEELRAIACRYMRGQSGPHTLQTTALVNEAYLRLVDRDDAPWQSESHYLAVAARAMRSILVDHARRRNAVKRGAGWQRTPLDGCATPFSASRVDFLALDEGLSKLASIYPQHAKVVELRFFGGLSVAETAEVMGVSTATVKRDWRMARAWLRRELEGKDHDEEQRSRSGCDCL